MVDDENEDELSDQWEEKDEVDFELIEADEDDLQEFEIDAFEHAGQEAAVKEYDVIEIPNFEFILGNVLSSAEARSDKGKRIIEIYEILHQPMYGFVPDTMKSKIVMGLVKIQNIAFMNAELVVAASVFLSMNYVLNQHVLSDFNTKFLRSKDPANLLRYLRFMDRNLRI